MFDAILAEYNNYNKAIRHPGYRYSHFIVILLLYEILMLFGRTDKAVEYNGIEIWFQAFYLIDPLVSLVVSVLFCLYFYYYLRLDLTGTKTAAEIQKDRAIAGSIKKKYKTHDPLGLLPVPKYKPRPKPKFKINWYHWGFMIAEGVVWGGLIFIILPMVVFGAMGAIDPSFHLPQPVDVLKPMRPYQTNLVQDIALSLGGGFYAEWIFREWMSGKLPKWLTSGYVKKYVSVGKSQMNLAVMIVGSIIYALSHYVPPYGDLFHAYSLIYRIAFGILMYQLFKRRNLGIAVWAHIIYNFLYFRL